MAKKKVERECFQAQIHQALKDGDAKKASAIRAEMYRKLGEELDLDDIER